MIIGILISLFSTCGDFIESFLKRTAAVKDSGDIFPGHGGMLDRVFLINFRWMLLVLVRLLYIVISFAYMGKIISIEFTFHKIYKTNFFLILELILFLIKYIIPIFIIIELILYLIYNNYFNLDF